jgi:hypothetical protein
MRGTRQRRALERYRDEVSELIREHEPFGEIEDAIDDLPGLNLDEKAGLWLFAFSLDQQQEARAQVAQLAVVR